MNPIIYQYFATIPELAVKVLTIPIVLFSLTFHEVSHGFIAWKLGDPTARNLGRLSLNPIKHLDPIGALCMLLFHVGWAKPVPINTRNFKRPRSGMALTALAGPASNLILSFLSLVLYAVLTRVTLNAPVSDFAARFLACLFLFFYYAHIMNIALAVFNFLPIPPLDGSRIATLLLPPKAYYGLMKYERYIMIGFLILVWFGSFSGIISKVTLWISDGMIWLITRIPFFA